MADDGVPFGRYRLVGLLGQGGMATVYRAFMSGPMGFEKEVALKRLQPQAAEDEKLLRSLVNEARLGGQLRHPNIVETYELGEIGGIYFVALELVTGWSMDAILRHCRTRGEELPLSVVCEVMVQVCRGLHHAHELCDRDGSPANLIHRDLKPANLMVSRSGAVKVMDFGVAKAATNLYQTTAADTLKGTPIYMSPEQLMAAKLDRRSDIYSMGAILHELLTLQIPFPADSLPAIVYQIVECDLSACVGRVRARHEPMGDLLARCMAKEPQERFATARDLGSAVERIAAALPSGPTLQEWLDDAADLLPSAPAIGDFGAQGRPPGVVGDRSGLVRQTTLAGGEEAKGGSPPATAGGALDETTALPASSLPGGRAQAPVTDPRPAPPGGRSGAGTPPPHARQRDPAEPARHVGSWGTRWLAPLTPLRAMTALLLLVAAATAALLWRAEEMPPVGPPRAIPAGPEGEPSPALPVPIGGPGAGPPASIPGPGPEVPMATAAARAEGTPRRDLPAPSTARTPSAADGTADRITPVPPSPAPPAAAVAPREAPSPQAGETPPAMTAEAIINTIPWSDVWIDGTRVGRTMQRLVLPVGHHEVRLVCTACDPEAEQVHPLDVRAGGDNRLIVRFESAGTGNR